MRKYRALVCDDEPAAVKMIEKIIESRSEDFDVCGLVYNGQEALAFAGKNQVDLIITDVNMPLLDGISLITELQKVKPEMESIVISGYQEFEYVQGAIRANASDYVLKPVTPSKIIEALGKVKNKLDKEYALRNNEFFTLAREKKDHYEELKRQYNDTKIDKQKLFEEMTIYIHKHIKEDISVEQICKAMCVSQATLNRILRQYAGESYKSYLTTIRMKEAINILHRIHDIPIKNLALEVGYNDPFYFSKVFRNTTGVSPSEYVELEPQNHIL